MFLDPFKKERFAMETQAIKLKNIGSHHATIDTTRTKP